MKMLRDIKKDLYDICTSEEKRKLILEVQSFEELCRIASQKRSYNPFFRTANTLYLLRDLLNSVKYLNMK